MVFFNYYWFSVRFVAMFFIISLIIDLEFIFLIINFIFLHIINGITSVLFDYIHKKKLSFFLLGLLKIFLIENLLQVSKFFF
uniref:Succinate:cytochrome c oxidoreductase subunit 4 n=1 Tax=Dasya binghamiae TaxID=1896963 RepID=A0A1C8XRT2_9FLOR|nr:succinate:cytochrome c oxidoreductase subunit 4 [Dasya binghamiae]AOH77195.1 succinate:cytochrome c oxidoreductase subunit 4 [Dasya binghamiae]